MKSVPSKEKTKKKCIEERRGEEDVPNSITLKTLSQEEIRGKDGFQESTWSNGRGQERGRLRISPLPMGWKSLPHADSSFPGRQALRNSFAKNACFFEF